MPINNVSPPPIDNDPPPPTDEGKKKLQQFISKSTWGSFKTWLSLQVTAALNQILQLLQNVTFDGNKGVGSINGLPATPGMAQLLGSGQFGLFLSGGKIRAQNWTPALVVVTGSYTFGTPVGIYYQVGNLVFIEFLVTIATFTTAGYMQFSVPPGLPLGTAAVMAGRENAISGYMLQAYNNSSTTMIIAKYDGTNSVAAAGDQMFITGVYYTP
jgi:hypothetical protein